MKYSLDKNNTHLAGEYFVAAELYRRGYSVALTIGNAKAIDLFAEMEGHTLNIQVKAIRNKKSICWTINEADIKDNIIYIFVCLNDPGISPDYYICTSIEAREKVKQYSTRGSIDLSTLRTSQYQERWDKIVNVLVYENSNY